MLNLISFRSIFIEAVELVVIGDGICPTERVAVEIKGGFKRKRLHEPSVNWILIESGWRESLTLQPNAKEGYVGRSGLMQRATERKNFEPTA